jgi:mono/diheme cytochrome c family protein
VHIQKITRLSHIKAGEFADANLIGDLKKPKDYPMTRVLTHALAAIMLTTPAMAQDISDGDASVGNEIFLEQCATCHGRDGGGNGPMAAILTLQPTDLTALARQNAGLFPTLRVVMRIDGREPLVSHGSPMPIFGDFFEGSGAALKTNSGQPILTSQPIVDLVAFLQDLQE